MAEIQYGEVGADAPAMGSAQLSGIVNWLGALLSLTLMAGLTFWGYQLMVRDVSGVPVVRALEGPMRIMPLDPGGLNAQHQGLAVNNIAAIGEAEAPAERLVLAPKPTALNGQDLTAGELADVQANRSASALVADDASEAGLSLDGLVPGQAHTESSAIVLDQAALIEATLKQVENINAPLENTATVAATVLVQNDIVAISVPGVSLSLRPMRRPPGMIVTPPVAAVTNTPGQVHSINPADVPVGTRLAQLGAFASVEIAQSEWQKISANFNDYMADKSRVIEQAQSGGEVFYRLRAHGFADLSDARRFCSALLDGQANCIPVVTR